MSESEVTQIRDEDVLRRMWQQTEDFSRKKEIRAHMYRLREERLRNLYSPEPAPGGKGCEFTSEQGHVKSFADQNFQSMKSKEVRDAGSPPKEFTYRGQDLKELSNAGWNVESENRTTDDGRTHVKSVNANIEGRYDVEGGRGQFAAVDHQRQATTEYRDDNSSMRRDETSSDTAAHEHVVRQTDDGTRVSSTTSSSNTSSKFQQVSSTKHETVPYIADDDYDLARRTAHDTNRNEQVTSVTNRNDYEQQTSRNNDFADAELVSRKIDYPDDNTKVIVETRCLPDGTRVTSTRREFRAPAQSTRSEYQTRSENKSYSSQHKSDTRDSTSKTTRHTINNRSDDIVDSQRNVDDNDFKRQIRQYTVKDNDFLDKQQQYVTKTNRKVTDHTQTDDDYYQKRCETRSDRDREDFKQTLHSVVDHRANNEVDETDRCHVTRTRDHDIQHKVFKEARQINDEERSYNITTDRKNTEEKFHHISKDTTATDKRVHDIPKDTSLPDEIIPKDRIVPDVHYIRRDETVPEGIFHDIPRERTLPDDKTQHTPRDSSAGKTRDFPTDEKEPKERVHDVSMDKTVTKQRVHNITRDTKVQEVVERKTSNDHYETTYQNDFQSRKVSTDWSPTHQAWASTLRSDTPTTTRPSTRASSPGSRTFKSSASSLRSSVSPDKSSRKPLSRGSSPNKIDRYSPTRVVTSNQYSSTHSTNSVTEVRTNKTTSPERKPPNGRSPARPGYSPERKQQDVRNRPSASPEKKPQNFTGSSSSSPERKPSQKSLPTDRHPRTTSPTGKIENSKSPIGPRQSPQKEPTNESYDEHRTNTYPRSPRTSPTRSNFSPEKNPIDGYPNRTSPKSTLSPDRKSGHEKPAGSSTADYPNNDSPSRPLYSADSATRKSGTSPDRAPNYLQSSALSRKDLDKPLDKHPPGSTAKRPSVSPDRKPNFMRPTAASQPDDKTRKSSKEESDRKSPTKQVLTYSPDRKSQATNKFTKITEDHYRFVDEETKVCTRTDKTDIDKKSTEIASDDFHLRARGPSPAKKLPSKSPSPEKNTVETAAYTNTKNQTRETIKQSTKTDQFPGTKPTLSREASPSKYGTYDKKKPRGNVKSVDVTTTTTDDNTNKDFKYDLLTHEDTTLSEKVSDIPLSPKKKSPRDSTSPEKSPNKDVKYKHTTDYIATEITTEEYNKKATMKDRSRQLITPSSSPTRKPKTTETETSTGQSSPTTSVSGFIYFSSQMTEKPIVTDLDEFYPDSEEINKRPQTLDIKRSPSPSKIPCRSPSPEKHIPTIKDNLPRKSSLKKPSADINKVSPIEKPPTSFQVSPTNDKPDILEQKIIKKENLSESEPGEPETNEREATIKPKPPLQRRETYEDRCKKILGMINDTTTESKETRKHITKPDSSHSSPSVSPCESPTFKDSSPLPGYTTTKKTTSTKVDVTDFTTHEQAEFNKTTITRDNTKSEITPRESSPTKLQDTVAKTTISKIERKGVAEDLASKTVKTKQPSLMQSPIKPGYPDSDKNGESLYLNQKNPKEFNEDNLQERPNESPERKPFTINPSQNTKTSPSRLNMSPERKPINKNPKQISLSKSSPERVPGYSKRTSVSSMYDTTTKLEEVQKTTVTTKNTEKSKPTRVLESPAREVAEPDISFSDRNSKQTRPQTISSPSEPQPKDQSSPLLVKKTTSPHRTLEADYPPDSHSVLDDICNDNITRSRLRKTPERTPGYMKTTTANTSKYDSTLVTDSEEKSHTTRTQVRKESTNKPSSSPTRQTPKGAPRADSPTKTSLPNFSPQKKPVKDVLAKISNNQESRTLQLTEQQEVPGYMKTTTAATTKIDTTIGTDNIYDTTKTKMEEKKYTSLSRPDSPTRKVSQPKSSPEHRAPSPTKPTHPLDISLDRKPIKTQQLSSPIKEITTNKPGAKYPTAQSPTRMGSEKIPGYMKSTASVTSKYETTEYDVTTTENIHENITKSTTKSYPGSINSEPPTQHIPKSTNESTPEYPDRKTSSKSPVKETPLPESKRPKDISSPKRPSVGSETPSYMKPTASMTSKFDTTSFKDSQDMRESNINEHKIPSPRTSMSPDRCNMEYENRYPSEPDEPGRLRTPSPIKKPTKIIKANTDDFIISEREQEVLNKVQKSLRKLSPERKERSPSRERSPTKTTTSLQDLDIITTGETQNDKLTNEHFTEIAEEQISITSKTIQPEQNKETKPNVDTISSKPFSRNLSPIKRIPPASAINKDDKSPESPSKSRSISPKKPISNFERPHSPHVPKVSGIKPREPIAPHLTRKPTPVTLSTTRIERLSTDVKKSNGVTKQNVTKTTTSKTSNRYIPSHTIKNDEPEHKRGSTPKGVKENISPKKDAVMRTSSDIAIKTKKTSSPQRMKSKPEIQISDMSTKSTKSQKSMIKEHHSKLPNKPKSATALNTSTDDDDIIIDVQQSKSSRENSPDRICPTPVNFSEDVGIPRFPDEVSEPDDDIVKRTYHTIHETESVVDDIVEICEDEELFVKKLDNDDDSLLSVNDKVNKFTSKIHSVSKPKDTVTLFKDTEKKNHSDFIDENLRSDECLLTVSQKVNKFAKGPRDTNDSRSPSRKITHEYDNDTVYQDDYTKLSVNDKAHLFVETAENVKITKVKPAQVVVRPDLSHIDESLKSDDCLLSVSDKVSKFVKTAEQYLTESQVIEETENKIKEQHDKIIKQIVDSDDETCDTKDTINLGEMDIVDKQSIINPENKSKPQSREPKISQSKVKDYGKPTNKPVERVPAVKITTLRSSEAVKKAKALFEHIASTQKTTQKDTVHTTKTTKLTDIGVTEKSLKSDMTKVLHPYEDESRQMTDVDSEVHVTKTAKDHVSSSTLNNPQCPRVDEKPRSSPDRLTTQSPEVSRLKSPIRQSIEVTTTKTILSKYPGATRAESPRQRTESPRQRTESPRQRSESEKPERVPGYLRPTKTSQIKEETKVVEDSDVSSRRGSGKFGVELRRTSVERSTISSERRRSVEHHQPCIEDIYDLDLLEQMLEKVMGYEQRRRIRAQIRIAKTQSEQVVDTYTKTSKQTTTAIKNRSPERKIPSSQETASKIAPQKTSSSDRHGKSTPHKTISDRNQPKEPTMNGHTKETNRTTTMTRERPHSPEKPTPKSNIAPRTPVRQASPDKRRTVSPSKAVPKPKGNRFNEYASAYMKKVGLNESDKIQYTDIKTKRTSDTKHTVKQESQQINVQEYTSTKSFTERTSSKDVIEVVQTNGKRSPSPQQRQSPEHKLQFPERSIQVSERKAQSPERKAQSPIRKTQSPVLKGLNPDRKVHSPEQRTYSPERKVQSPERLHQRTPSPDFKRPKSDAATETIKTVYDIEKKVPSKPIQEQKPSWVTNRNLKKTTSETRTYSSKKIENEKPKYRAPSPSKVISKPIDVITSSYGPGPLDADGKPLFGIKALRNGATNFQVKGTVIRQEFHSHNGGEPEGTVSVTAYSTQPEELQQLLAAQGGEPPSRIHGLAAITTTKKFGGDTGNTLSNVHTKEDRATLEQFTHHDRRVDNMESRTYDSRSDFPEDKMIEEILESTRRDDTDSGRKDEVSSSTKRIESKKEQHTENKNRSTRKEDNITHVKRGQKVEERREKVERREDKKTVRQSSVKSLTEKYIKSANDSGKADRSTYPKAGLILRTTTMRDSVSSDDAHPAGLVRTDSEHSLCSVDDNVVTTTERTGDGMRTTTTHTTHHHGPTVTTHTRGSTVVTHHEPVITTKKTIITQEPVITHRVISHEPVIQQVTRGQGSTTTTERSFLDSNTKVTGVQDILSRMKNADIVIQEGDTTEDSEARALLNKFLGATVLMAGMQGYVAEQPSGKLLLKQDTVRSSDGGGKVTSRSVEELDLDQCWDERLLKNLLEECTDYEQRRRLRARIRTLMAEQEACASAVTEALGADGAVDDGSSAREEEEITVTSSVRRDSSDKTVSSSTTTTTSKVIEMTRSAPKPVSPFAKFRQLEKQNSTNSPNSPKTPQSPGSPSQPYFKFTDPALQCSALTIKERLLQWCRDKTRDYENVKLENFSTSWADGLAFCALVHHFLPDAFDYSKLTADKRRHNFTLAFKVADEKAGIYPLLDVDDMVAMRKPDWKCVFTYVQAIYRRFKDEQ